MSYSCIYHAAQSGRSGRWGLTVGLGTLVPGFALYKCAAQAGVHLNFVSNKLVRFQKEFCFIAQQLKAWGFCQSRFWIGLGHTIQLKQRVLQRLS